LQASSNNKNPTPGTTDLTAKCKKFLSMFNKTKKSLATREKITVTPPPSCEPHRQPQEVPLDVQKE